MSDLLELIDVQTYYGNIQALKDITLSVGEGEIITLIGANGAGKSTTLMSISGIVPPRAGDILFMGRSLGGVSPNEIVALGISQVPEGRRIFPYLTVTENLDMGAFLRKDKAGVKKDMEHIFELFPILAERRNQPGGTLSGGEQQMLAIARGLMSRPRLLMLDEMSLGLMPTLVEKMMETVVAINRSGVTVLLVEQMVQEALEIAHRGYVLQSGRIVQSGPSRELLDSEEIRKAYMGM